MDAYEQQATDFLKSTGTEFKTEFLRFGKHFDDDKESRDIYKITLKRGRRSFSFDFGQSIRNSQQWVANTTYAKNLVHKAGDIRLMGKTRMKMLSSIGVTFDSGVIDNDFSRNKYYSEPTAYDVLACLTKYDVGTLEDFCGEFGYDTDSKKAEKIYKAVVKEYDNVCKLWTDEEIEQLQEIN